MSEGEEAKVVKRPDTYLIEPDKLKRLKDIAWLTRRSKADLIREGIDFVIEKYSPASVQTESSDGMGSSRGKAETGEGHVPRVRTESGENTPADSAEELL